MTGVLIKGALMTGALMTGAIAAEVRQVPGQVRSDLAAINLMAGKMIGPITALLTAEAIAMIIGVASVRAACSVIAA